MGCRDEIATGASGRSRLTVEISRHRLWQVYTAKRIGCQARNLEQRCGRWSASLRGWARQRLCAVAFSFRLRCLVLPQIIVQLAAIFLESEPTIYSVTQMGCLQNTDAVAYLARLKQGCQCDRCPDPLLPRLWHT